MPRGTYANVAEWVLQAWKRFHNSVLLKSLGRQKFQFHFSWLQNSTIVKMTFRKASQIRMFNYDTEYDWFEGFTDDDGHNFI